MDYQLLVLGVLIGFFVCKFLESKQVNKSIKKDAAKVVDFVTDTQLEEADGGKLVMCRCWKSKTFPFCVSGAALRPPPPRTQFVLLGFWNLPPRPPHAGRLAHCAQCCDGRQRGPAHHQESSVKLQARPARHFWPRRLGLVLSLLWRQGDIARSLGPLPTAQHL